MITDWTERKVFIEKLRHITLRLGLRWGTDVWTGWNCQFFKGLWPVILRCQVTGGHRTGNRRILVQSYFLPASGTSPAYRTRRGKTLRYPAGHLLLSVTYRLKFSPPWRQIFLQFPSGIWATTEGVSTGYWPRPGWTQYVARMALRCPKG